jgi:hypothetical protein
VLAKPFEPHMVITRVKELLAAGAGAKGASRASDGAAASRVPAVEDRGAGAGEPLEAELSAVADAPGADLEPIPLETQAADAPLRMSSRTPIAVPGFGAPATPAESHAALDEYFDRLDAAFTTLKQAPATAADAVQALPAAGDGVSAGIPAAAVSAGASAPPVEPAVAGPTPAPAPRAGQVPGIAQAFSALFAAERGETAPDVPAFIGPSALPQPTVDDLVERVTRQVLERLSDRVVRDTVTDVVSRVAERLVRDEIERVKATLK